VMGLASPSGSCLLSPKRTSSANRAAVHFTYMAALCPSSRYPYGGMAYADPDAVTQTAALSLSRSRSTLRGATRSCDPGSVDGAFGGVDRIEGLPSSSSDTSSTISLQRSIE
jgi:hypothetical protein